MSELPVVVIDPGHGGLQGTRNRGSSWNRARGPNGLLEKDVAFDLALRTAARLRDHARVEITRSEEGNPSLGERAELARRNKADVFLSLHLNGSNDPAHDGTDVYVAPDAMPRSRALGQSVWQRLVGVTGATRGGLGSREIGTLVGRRHAPSTAACLAEIAYLTNERQARALEQESYRNQIADALSGAIREHLAAPQQMAESLAAGDGSPFVEEAVKSCWGRCEQLRLASSNPANPNAVSAHRIHAESGITVDRNPYFGIGRNEIEAVIRAGYTSHAMPEVLLALWAKEGSTRSVTTPVEIPQAASDANARTIFRNKVYYEDLGADYFILTTRAGSGSDNRWDDSDAAAPGNETHFAQRVADLVTGGHLREDIAGAINRELTVSNANGHRAVVPSTRFYALSLLLMDALWKKFRQTGYTLLPSISDPMNYLQWNMGGTAFGTFLTSAAGHRGALTIEQWSLHTAPKAREYPQPRTNAIKFLHYIESYKPVFTDALNLIKPGIEDLRPDANTAELGIAPVAEAMAVPSFANANTIAVSHGHVRMPIAKDDIIGPFGRATMSTVRVARAADLPAQFPGTLSFPDATSRTDPADPDSATNLFTIPTADIALGSFLRAGAGGNIEVALNSVLCWPSDPGNPNRLNPAITGKCPIAIVVHGNHTALDALNGAGTGAPVATGSTTASGAPLTLQQFQMTGFTPHNNHFGYSSITPGTTPYLQEELARIGFVSMSIDQNGANLLNLLVTMRGELILQYLDKLRAESTNATNRFHNKLDFNRVALIGHSRGGDAVVKALQLNAARPVATRFGIRAVVSISPTDMTGVLSGRPGQVPLNVEAAHRAAYLVIYGSEDGDVMGGDDGAHGGTGTGFRYYDRASSPRAMVYIHGANHDRFNREWPDETDSNPTVTRGDQETLASEYVAGWLRLHMLGDTPSQNLFNGTAANSLGLAVSLMWKFGPAINTIERYQDAVDTTNTLAGRVTKPAYVSEVRIDAESPPDPLLPHVSLPTFPHVDRVARANPVTGAAAPLREEIPAPHRDVRRFNHLTFRVTKKYPLTQAALGTGVGAPGGPGTAAFPDFSITLEDASGHRATIANAAILGFNTRRVKPWFREALDGELAGSHGLPAVPLRNITKCNLETWRVPLSAFTAALSTLSLAAIRAVEFNFNAAASQPVYIDTISLVKIP